MSKQRMGKYSKREVPLHVPQHANAFEHARAAHQRVKKGSFEDREDYPLLFDNYDSFLRWMRQEEQKAGVQLNIGRIKACENKDEPTFYRERRYFTCARNGAQPEAPRKHSNGKYDHSVPSKKLGWGGCNAMIVVKTFWHTQEVLARYDSEHSHPLAAENARFCRVTRHTREFAEGLIRMGVELPEVMSQLDQKRFESAEEIALSDVRADLLVDYDYLRRLKTRVEGEKYRKDSSDAVSVHRWVKLLRARDSILAYKQANEHHPGLADKDFVLIIQTPWQRKVFGEIGRHVLCIDGTHNTQVYGYTLFTLVSRDEWGHGIPVAYMISSSGTAETLGYYLSTFRSLNPTRPSIIMSDFDWAQINAIIAVYGINVGTLILLCWWHVLRAWSKHLPQAEKDTIWPLLTSLLREQTSAGFNSLWSEICAKASSHFVEYMRATWMGENVIHMWSAVYRTGRSINQFVDTNMLIEAWHGVLKRKFMGGKRNRRMDNLIQLLVEPVQAHYVKKHLRRLIGREGPDLAAEALMRCKLRAEQVPIANIVHLRGTIFEFASQHFAETKYTIDLAQPSCTCSDFSRDSYCKHKMAVRHHFPSVIPSDELSAVSEVAQDAFQHPVAPLPAEMGEGSDDDLAQDGTSTSVRTLYEAEADGSAATLTGLDWESVFSQVMRLREDASRISPNDWVQLLSLLSKLLDGVEESKSSLPAPERLPPNVRTSTETLIAMGRGMPRKPKAGRKPQTSKENFFLDMRRPFLSTISTTEIADTGFTMEESALAGASHDIASRSLTPDPHQLAVAEQQAHHSEAEEGSQVDLQICTAEEEPTARQIQIMEIRQQEDEANRVLKEWQQNRDMIKTSAPGDPALGELKARSAELSQRQKALIERVEALKAGGLLSVIHGAADAPRRARVASVLRARPDWM